MSRQSKNKNGRNWKVEGATNAQLGDTWRIMNSYLEHGNEKRAAEIRNIVGPYGQRFTDKRPTRGQLNIIREQWEKDFPEDVLAYKAAEQLTRDQARYKALGEKLGMKANGPVKSIKAVAKPTKKAPKKSVMKLAETVAQTLNESATVAS